MCHKSHVRDNKVYKQTDHKTFEAFAEAEIGISRKEAYRLISDYEVRLNVSDSTQKPTSVSQTEQLAKLYREQYDRFEDYCKERWGWSPQHAGYVIGVADVTLRIEEISSIAPPVNAAQARPLTKLPTLG